MLINFKRIRSVNRGLLAAQRIWYNALGLKFDPYHSCTNWCVYCYARYVEKFCLDRQHKVFDPTSVRLERIDKMKGQFERVLDKGIVNENDFIDYAISKKMPIECGTVGESFQENDLVFRVAYGFLQLLDHYDYPLFVNTKANLLVKSKEYFNLLVKLKHLIVDLTLPSLNDDLLKKWEPKAPLASERFELLKRLVDKGVNVVVSARPIVPGATDVDFEEYMEKLCKAGIKAYHPRPMFIMPNMRKANPAFFNKVIKEGNFIWARGMFQWRNYPVFMNLLKKAITIGEKYGVPIVGAHRYFFRLSGNWNKADYRMMPNFYPYIFPYTIPAFLEKIYKNRDKEHILKFNDIVGEVENRAFSISQQTSPLFNSTSDTLAVRGSGNISLKNIIKEALWGTWRNGIKSRKFYRGELSTLFDIHLLTKNGEPLRDEEGNVIYKYTPTKERFNFDDTNSEPIEV